MIGKSTTRPWRSHYNRFLAAVHNYVVYLKEYDNSVVDNLPSLALLKSVLTVMEQVKLFFDRVEVDDVTSHLSFVNYLLLDMLLFDRQMDESEHGVTRNLCQDLRGQMEQKLWMYSGSPFSQSAAFLSGLDIPKTIRGYVMQHSRSKKSVHKTFATNWLKVAAEHDTIVDQYLEQLFGKCEPSVKP